MNMPKLKLIANTLKSINPILILKERKRIEGNRREISYTTIYEVISKEVHIFIDEMPNFLEYEIYGFQEAARKGEFTFPKLQSIKKCIAIYFKYEAKYLDLNIRS